MEAKACRTLMVMALILFIAAEMIGQSPQQWLSLSDNPSLRSMFFVTGGIVAAFFAVCLVGFFGMYNFKAWGRSISLVVTVTSYVIWAGVIVFSPLATEGADLAADIWMQSLISQLSALCWGGALALAYLSPLSTRYGANNSFNPMPLRGTG